MTRTKPTKLPLIDRLMLHAKHLKDEAAKLPLGPLRDAMLRRASQTETAAHIDQWLSSRAPQTPV
jgi:hypothetical protein